MPGEPTLHQLCAPSARAPRPCVLVRASPSRRATRRTRCQGVACCTCWHASYVAAVDAVARRDIGALARQTWRSSACLTIPRSSPTCGTCFTGARSHTRNPAAAPPALPRRGAAAARSCHATRLSPRPARQRLRCVFAGAPHPKRTHKRAASAPRAGTGSSRATRCTFCTRTRSSSCASCSRPPSAPQPLELTLRSCAGARHHSLRVGRSGPNFHARASRRPRARLAPRCVAPRPPGGNSFTAGSTADREGLERQAAELRPLKLWTRHSLTHVLAPLRGQRRARGSTQQLQAAAAAVSRGSRRPPPHLPLY